MKKLAKLLLVGALALESLQAKELFNLKAQDFQYTLGNKIVNAKYKVGDVIVETNLIKESAGYYRAWKSTVSYLNLTPQKQLNNFTLNLDVIYNSTTRYYEGNRKAVYNSTNSTEKRYIKLIDESGKNLILEFHKDGFNILGKEYKAKTDLERMLITIKRNNDKIMIKIGNTTLYDDKVDFGTLKYIDTSYMNFFLGAKEYSFDKLNNIILVSHD